MRIPKISIQPVPRSSLDGRKVVCTVAPASREIEMNFDDEVEESMAEVALNDRNDRRSFSKPATLKSVGVGSVVIEHSNGVKARIPVAPPVKFPMAATKPTRISAQSYEDMPRPLKPPVRRPSMATRAVAPAIRVFDVSLDDPEVGDPMDDAAISVSDSWSKPAVMTGIGHGPVARGSAAVTIRHSNGVVESFLLSRFDNDTQFWVGTLRMLMKDVQKDPDTLMWPGVLSSELEVLSFKVDMSRDFPNKDLLEEDTLTVYGILRS